MLPAAMPSRVLISAYGTDGSPHSRAISCWQDAGTRECLAQRRVALGREQFLPGRCGLVIGNFAGVGHVPGWVRPPGTQDPDAFPLGRGGEPASKCGRITDFLQLFEQAQPDALAHLLSVRPVQPVAPADSPDQRRVTVHQRVPRLPVAVPGAGDQINDHG